MSPHARAFLYGLGAGAALWPFFYAAGQIAAEREALDHDDDLYAPGPLDVVDAAGDAWPGPVDAEIYCGAELHTATPDPVRCKKLDRHAPPHISEQGHVWR